LPELRIDLEIVERINLVKDHCRVGIFRPIQEACIAALTRGRTPRASSVTERPPGLLRRSGALVGGALACELGLSRE
jgi:hypothetical protein